MQGGNMHVSIILPEPVVLARRSHFTIQESGRTVGIGVVKRVKD